MMTSTTMDRPLIYQSEGPATYGLAQLKAPYSQLHGMPVSPRTIFTIPGSRASARTSFDRMTTQRLCSSIQTQVLPVESLWPPF